MKCILHEIELMVELLQKVIRIGILRLTFLPACYIVLSVVVV